MKSTMRLFNKKDIFIYFIAIESEAVSPRGMGVALLDNGFSSVEDVYTAARVLYWLLK